MTRMVTLGEIATVQQGISRSGRGAGAREGPWQVQLATASAIQADRLLLDQLETVALEYNSRTERYLLRHGDLLVTARSTSARMALVPLEASRAVADASLLIVRSLDPLLPLGPYLWWYFTSYAGRTQVEARMVGATILSLPARSLMEIELPLPAEPQLELIAGLVVASEQAYAAALGAATLRRTIFRDRIIDDLHEGRPGGIVGAHGVRPRAGVRPTP